MKRFLLAAVLALVAASQADAQLLRRYRPMYSNSIYSPYVYDSSSGIITAGYTTTPIYSYRYYPGTYYYPAWSGNYSYPAWSGYYGNVNSYRYGSPSYGWRRGWRW